MIAAELAWLGWFLTTPLPNANDPLQDPAKLKNTRGLLLMRLAPEIVPGVTFQESLLGGVWEKTRRVENLSERLPLFAAALWIATAGTALGEWLLRAARLRDRFSIAERLPLAFGVGMSCLSGLTLILGKLGALGAWPARGLLIALTVAGALALLSRPRSRSPQSQSSPLPSAPTWRLSSFWPLAVALPFAALMILGAMTPPFDFDSLEYHLQGPKEYFQAGRIGFLPHNVYTSMPFQTEMGTYLGMLVLKDWRQGALVGQVLTAMHAPMDAWLIGLTTARWSGSTWAGS